MLCDASCVGGLCRCPSTGSPFGHHPRLRMVCPRWGQWVSTRDTQLNSIPAYRLCSCGYSRSLLRRSSLSHILYGMYAFVDTLTAPPPHPHLHRAASGGGAPCLTAGDTRTIVRANPWRSGQTTALPSDTGGVALTALREYSSSLLLRKYSILLSRVITLITDMFSISYMQSVTT